MTDTERDALLAEALVYAGGTHAVADVLEAIGHGTFQEWRGARSVIVTQVIENPRVKEACAFLAAGDMGEIQTLYPFLEEWAKSLGCQRLSFHGRPGWERTFLTKAEGWKSGLVVFEKELHNGKE